MGVDLVIKSKLVSHLSELPYGVSDRLMALCFQLLFGYFMTMISVYVLTLVSSGADTDNFCFDFRNILRNVNRDDKVVLIGDFNARVGCDHAAWSSFGTGKCNRNDLLFL